MQVPDGPTSDSGLKMEVLKVQYNFLSAIDQLHIQWNMEVFWLKTHFKMAKNEHYGGIHCNS